MKPLYGSWLGNTDLRTVTTHPRLSPVPVFVVLCNAPISIRGLNPRIADLEHRLAQSHLPVGGRHPLLAPHELVDDGYGGSRVTLDLRRGAADDVAVVLRVREVVCGLLVVPHGLGVVVPGLADVIERCHSIAPCLLLAPAYSSGWQRSLMRSIALLIPRGGSAIWLLVRFVVMTIGTRFEERRVTTS